MELDNLKNDIAEKENLIINNLFIEEEEAEELEVSAVSSISTFGCISGCGGTASTWRP